MREQLKRAHIVIQLKSKYQQHSMISWCGKRHFINSTGASEVLG